MEIAKSDIDYMIKNGVSPFMKSHIKSLFSGIDVSEAFVSFFKFCKGLVFVIAKTMTTFFILSKIYSSIGLDKFLILLRSGYIAQSVLKENRKNVPKKKRK